MTRSISSVPADDRVELAVAGELGEVAAERIERGGLALALGAGLLAGALDCGGFAAGAALAALGLAAALAPVFLVR